MISFGDKQSFGVDLVWSGDEAMTAAEATRGKLRLWVGSRSVWGSTGGLEWTWVELLEHLARFWPCLLLEECDPLGLGVPAEKLQHRARERWANAAEAQRDDEEAAVFAYLEAHDLAAGLGGVFPASVYCTRQGELMRVAARDTVVRPRLAEVEGTLVALGDEIAARLASLDDPRAVEARSAWSAREADGPVSAAAIATGMRESEVHELFGKLDPGLAASGLRALRPSDELLAVARMTAGTLLVPEVASILEQIAQQPQVWTKPIDELAAHVAPTLLRLRDAQPWLQGHEVAAQVRAHLGCSPEQRLDPEAILRAWKVPVRDIEVASPLLDALCVWGPKHGPLILVNRRGHHGRLKGRRATLAHEIGHLVMDRGGGLPVAEVLGGRVPEELEQRAKAFAAELLLPKAVASARVSMADDVRDEVRLLSEEFGASLELVAWQARNGAAQLLPRAVHATLRGYVSDPNNF